MALKTGKTVQGKKKKMGLTLELELTVVAFNRTA